MTKDEQKKCVACARDIPTAATLCDNCGTHQHGFRRFIAFSGTFLTVLIAILTISLMILPLIKTLWLGTYSKINFSQPSLHEKRLNVTVSNNGNTDGLITDAIILSSDDPACINSIIDQHTNQLMTTKDSNSYHKSDFKTGSFMINLIDSGSTIPAILGENEKIVLKLHIATNDNNCDYWAEEGTAKDTINYLLIKYKDYGRKPQSKIFRLNNDDIPENIHTGKL